MPDSAAVQFASQRYIRSKAIGWGVEGLVAIGIGVSEARTPAIAALLVAIGVAIAVVGFRTLRLGLWVDDDQAVVKFLWRTVLVPLDNVASVAEVGGGRRPVPMLLLMAGLPVRIPGWEGEHPFMTPKGRAHFDARVVVANAEIDRRRGS